MTNTPWQSGKINLDGSNIHYTRTGGAKPALVLSHGITDDGLCWSPLARALEAQYDVIMVDARGHGLSDPPGESNGSTEQAADLAGVITALDLHRPFLLGHSMGAATTLTLAGLYPHLPGAILLEDPPEWWRKLPPSPQAAAHREGFFLFLQSLKSKTRAELLADQRLMSPTWSEEELEPWADSKLRFNPAVLNLFRVDPADAVDWRAVLPRIQCPALLITADPALGAAVTPEGAAALQALVPQLHVAHIPGAGHNIRREQFGLYLDAVRGFLSGSG